jgi:hypothetical protein
MLIAATSLLSGCGGSGGSTSGTVSAGSGTPIFYQMPRAAALQQACVANSVTQEFNADGSPSGEYCAIQPSALDPQTLDAGSTSAGYGYHAIYFPTTASFKGIFVYFPGSGVRPYDQSSDTFSDASFFDENQARGYLMIKLANDNEVAANSYCGIHYDVDNCMGIVRHQLLTASDPDAALIPELTVDAHNSIDARLARVFDELIAMGVLPADTNVLDANGQVAWQNVSVGGSSQGSGDAYYIAKNVAEVVHACLLSGPDDIPDTQNPGSYYLSDWQQTGARLTPADRIDGLAGDGDERYTGAGFEYSTGTSTLSAGALNLQYAYGAMGLSAQLQILTRSGQVMSVSHEDVTNDPAFAAQRGAACMP